MIARCESCGRDYHVDMITELYMRPTCHACIRDLLSRMRLAAQKVVRT